MTSKAYLLPPNQRSKARFMNLKPQIDWANRILASYGSLDSIERKIFKEMKNHQSIIKELTQIIDLTEGVKQLFHRQGLSKQSIKMALNKCDQPEYRRRVIKAIRRKIINYLHEENLKLPNLKTSWYNSSEVIESIFAKYKNNTSPNTLHGVTPHVLIIPLLTKINQNFDFKAALEDVYLYDINEWAKDHLIENQVEKRKRKLNAA